MMKTYLRGVALVAALVVTLTACGGGGDTKGAAERLGGGNNASSSAAPTGGGTETSAPAAGADAGAAQATTPAAVAASPAAGGNSSGAGTASAAAASGGSKSGGSATGGASTPGAASGSSPGAKTAAGSSSGGGGKTASGSASSPSPAPGPTPAPGGAAPGGPDKIGLTQNEILFGIHLPQSGPVGVLLGNAWKGADAYFRSINDAGGINGRKLRLVVADDKYSAQGAASAVRELVDNKKVFGVGCPVGVDQCSVSSDYANSKGVPYLSGGFREKYLEDKPWVFPISASYPYGGARLLDYMFEKRGYTKARKIGFFYLHSENLEEMVQRADQELTKFGTKFAVKFPAEKDQSDFSAAITKMQGAGVDTVWFHVAPDLSTKFAAQAKILGFKPQYVFTLPVGGDIFAAAAGGNLDKAFGVAGFADPQWSGAAKYRDLFKKYYPNDDPDEFNLLNYLVAYFFTEGVKKVGPDLGREVWQKAMSAIDLIDTGISQPVSYTKRGRILGPNSTFAVWEIHGTQTDQVTGFDF